jgi:hypothetical protein
LIPELEPVQISGLEAVLHLDQNFTGDKGSKRDGNPCLKSEANDENCRKKV